MYKKLAILTMLTCLLLLAACSSQKGSSALSAVLSELQGKVEMKQGDSGSFAPVSKDAVLEVNGQIQTGDDGRVRLDLSTGTIIRVAPSSLFTLTSNNEVDGSLATKIKLEVGKIFIILNGGTADVETPSGVASVRGSYLKVWVDPETNDVYVTCLEGRCSAANPAGTVDFTDGEKTVLFHQDPATGNWTVPGVEPMTPEEFQEWLDNNPEAKELFNQAVGTMTAMAPKPTESPTSAPTEAPTTEPGDQPGGSSDACLNLIEPQAGSELPFQGLVKFEWESKTGAQKYRLTLTDANGQIITFDTTETSIEKYIEIMPDAGEYSWKVTAYGENNSEICSTESASFSKPDSNWQPDPKEEDAEPEPIPTDPPMEYQY